MRLLARLPFRLKPHRSKAEIPAYRDALRLSVFFLTLAPLLSLAKSRLPRIYRGCRLSGLLCSLPLLLFPSALVHAQWEPDRRLSFNDSLSSTSYNNANCIAVSGDTIHVVWFDHRDGNYEIYYKRSPDCGLTWSSDFRLTFAPDSSTYPAVAVTGIMVHIVWWDERDGGKKIYYKRSSDGGNTWGSDYLLADATAFIPRPTIAVSGSNIYVVWEKYLDGNYEIFYKRSTDSGSNWEPETRFTNNSPYDSGSPSIAVVGSYVHVVYWDYQFGNGVYYKRSTDSGANWGPNIRITDITPETGQPSVAAFGSNVYTVWRDSRDGNKEIYFKRSTDRGATWLQDTRLSYDSALSYGPKIATFGPIVQVLWVDFRDRNWEIYYLKSTDEGVTWCFETRLTYNSGYSNHPSVAVSGSMVHVVWFDDRDSNWEIYYKRNPTGNSGTDEVLGGRGQRIELNLSVIPNPFISFATLPGHSSERFVLYDISGRWVGVYRGERVGEDLVPGVYFLRPEGRDAKPSRIVKLR